MADLNCLQYNVDIVNLYIFKLFNFILCQVRLIQCLVNGLLDYDAVMLCKWLPLLQGSLVTK